MTQQHELDRILDAFFVDGTDELADRVLDAALDQIDHTHQRRRMRLPRRFQTMSIPVRLAAAALVGVLAVGGTLILFKPFSGVGNTEPTTEPSAGPGSAWTKTGSPSQTSARYSATRLPDGRVLVVGGGENHVAEIYDPSTGRWNATADIIHRRDLPASALLGDGRVLVVGSSLEGSETGDLFDPASGTWSDTTDLTRPRIQPSSISLPDGRVLVVGGEGESDSAQSAEIFDSATGTWTATKPMQVHRANASLALLRDGKVLAAGGFAGDRASLGHTAEIYDPATDTWTATGDMHASRVFVPTTVLPDGRVLIVGGEDEVTGDIYDPASQTWTSTGPVPPLPGDYLVAIALPDGSVLVTGGGQKSAVLDPESGSWTPVASGPAAGYVRSATPLANGKVLVAEGDGPEDGSDVPSELFDPTALP